MFPNLQLLLVEDDRDIANRALEVVANTNAEICVTWVECVDDAVDQIRGEEFFDAIILDLKLPQKIGGLDIDDTHGISILREILEYRPGTMVLVLSGSNNPDVFRTLLRNSSQCDCWSEGGERPSIEHIPKKDFPLFEDWVVQVDSAMSGLRAVELKFIGLVDDDFAVRHDRLLRSFLKSAKVDFANVSVLGGGLSGSRVLRIDDPEKERALVAKFDSRKKIEVDSMNYDHFVNELPGAATPRKLGKNDFGGADQSAVFYSLEKGFNQSFYSYVFSEECASAAVVENCKSHLKNWWSAARKEHCSVKKIRQLFLRDEDFDNIVEKYSLDWARSFESGMLNSRFSTIHADLHGENILVDPCNRNAILIDYGDVKDGPACYDPLTLECSLLFHPSAAEPDGWPSKANLEQWLDVDSFVDGAPTEIVNYIKTCRAWYEEVSYGPRDQAVALYAYAIRQLKHDGTNKQRAVKLLEVAQGLYHST
jgi:CheY-like chemotaxis protein